MMGKTKEPSRNKDESTTTGKRVAEIDNPEKNSHDTSAGRNEDELAEFEKTMGDLDSQEEKQFGGSPNDSGTGEKDEQELSEEEPAALNEDIETLTSENPTDAEAVDSEDSGDESLAEDQQRAFESIMAQIESDGPADTGSAKETVEASESEPIDDFSAGLEKVAKKADADDEARPVCAQRDELTDDDGLDPDQQQALESVMAQIEGGSTADADTRSAKETGDEPESQSVAGFSAELEEAVQNTVPIEHDEIQDADSTEPDDALTGDQQQAVESIKDQIEGGEPEPKETVSTTSASAGPQSEGRPEGQEQHAVDPAKDTSDDTSHHSSDDIEDILTEIALSDDESHLPEAASDDSGSKKATVEASEKNVVDDDIVAHQKADSGLEPPDRPQTATPAGQNEKTPEPDEKPLVKGPSVDPRSTTKPIPAGSKDRQKPEPLREAGEPAAGRQNKAVPASIVAILFLSLVLALAGYFYGIPPNMLASTPVSPDTDSGGRDSAVVVQSALQVQKPVAVVHGPSDQSRLNTAAENLDRLRSQIIEKQAEIGELRAYYQAGIDAEIQAIADKVRDAGKGRIPFKSAIADPSISLGLSAIQRRDTYITKLETPQSILVKSSEALLFFSRKAAMLALMSGKTSGIDIDGFIQQTDEIRNRHGSELAHLNIDAVPASPRTLASIWQDIEKRMPTTAVKSDKVNRGADTDNATIWKNICDGDFSQKHRLTTLSLEAARCLTAWKGKDLFLNVLTDLTPDAARHLSAWKGDWLGLNGLTELSPEVAVHLSRWKGKGLSLNSLSSLSPRVVAILSDWQGDQIELINVKHMAHWENPKTRLFLSEDLKRKLKATRK